MFALRRPRNVTSTQSDPSDPPLPTHCGLELDSAPRPSAPPAAYGSGNWLEDLHLPVWFVPAVIGAVFVSFMGVLLGDGAARHYIHLLTPGLLLAVLGVTYFLRVHQAEGDFKQFLDYLFLAAVAFLAGHLYWALDDYLVSRPGGPYQTTPGLANLFFTIGVIIVILMLVKSLIQSKHIISLKQAKHVVGATLAGLLVVCLPAAYFLTKTSVAETEIIQFFIFIVLASIVLVLSTLLLQLYRRRALHSYWLMLIVAAALGLAATGVQMVELVRGSYYVGGYADGLSLLMFFAIFIGEMALLEAKPTLLSYSEIVTRLEASEAHHRAVVETATDAILTADERGRITTFNRAAQKMFGYSEDEALARTLEDLLPGDFVGVADKGLDSYLEADGAKFEGSSLELEARRANGFTFPAQLSLSRVVEPDGSSSYTLILRDITAQKEAEVELARLASFPEDNPNPVVEVDPSGRITYLNPSAKKRFADLEVRGFDHPLLAGMERLEEGHQASGSSAEMEEIWVGGSLYSRKVYLRRGRPLRLFAHDITERKQAEEQLKAANEELATFVYTASHDLKSPVVSLTGFLGLLRESEEANLSAQGRHFLSRLEETAAQMRHMLDELVELTRASHNAPDMEEVDLNLLVEGLRPELEPYLARRQVLMLIPSDLPEVYGDREGLRQVFANLLTNALKFLGPADNPRVELAWRAEAEGYHFTVTDNGVGIDPAYHEKIFGPFQALKDRRAGKVDSTGLGLSIAKRILERHGGRIWVESNGQRGSAFHFTLPARPAAHLPKGPTPIPATGGELVAA